MRAHDGAHSAASSTSTEWVERTTHNSYCCVVGTGGGLWRQRQPVGLANVAGDRRHRNNSTEKLEQVMDSEHQWIWSHRVFILSRYHLLPSEGCFESWNKNKKTGLTHHLISYAASVANIPRLWPMQAKKYRTLKILFASPIVWKMQKYPFIFLWSNLHFVFFPLTLDGSTRKVSAAVDINCFGSIFNANFTTASQPMWTPHGQSYLCSCIRWMGCQSFGNTQKYSIFTNFMDRDAKQNKQKKKNEKNQQQSGRINKVKTICSECDPFQNFNRLLFWHMIISTKTDRIYSVWRRIPPWISYSSGKQSL